MKVLNKKKQDVTVPGFCFAGVAAGIKADPRKKDVALIYATAAATTAAGVFTQNRIAAAPVRLCRAHLKAGGARLVVVNSGCANAATGARGLADARATAAFAAKSLALKTGEVLVCSTGKIGAFLPMAKLKNGILLARERLHPQGFRRAAQAIMTTDAFEKTAVHRGRLATKPFTLAVMAKGAGMIHPDMATMLCYVLTDLKIPAAVLQKLLKECVDETLNALTVDGDTSTNDTVLMLASGAAGNSPLRAGSAEYNGVRAALTALLTDIAVKIALDGEGATKCLVISVAGAKNPAEAKRAAKAIGNSPLVKTAMFGCDPNWGRILAAAGYAGVATSESEAVVKIGKTTLYDRGRIFPAREKAVATYLRANRLVEITVTLGRGRGAARVFASDLTYGYVRINADYRTESQLALCSRRVFDNFLSDRRLSCPLHKMLFAKIFSPSWIARTIPFTGT